MVGYGESLLKARREGWHAAYLEYSSLKHILGEVGRLYEACDHAAKETFNGEKDALLASTSNIHEEAGVLESGFGCANNNTAADRANGIEMMKQGRHIMKCGLSGKYC